MCEYTLDWKNHPHTLRNDVVHGSANLLARTHGIHFADDHHIDVAQLEALQAGLYRLNDVFARQPLLVRLGAPEYLRGHDVASALPVALLQDATHLDLALEVADLEQIDATLDGQSDHGGGLGRILGHLKLQSNVGRSQATLAEVPVAQPRRHIGALTQRKRHIRRPHADGPAWRGRRFNGVINV